MRQGKMNKEVGRNRWRFENGLFNMLVKLRSYPRRVGRWCVIFAKKIENTMEVKRRSDFDEFFTGFFNALCLFIRQMLRNEEDIADLAQSVFLRVYEHWDEFETEDNAKAFLYTSARNICLDHIKHQKAKNRYLEQVALREEQEESFLNEIIREETFRILYDAIDKLPWQTRQVVLLCMSGDSNAEVGEKLGISINTVKTLKKNAYAILRALLSSEYAVFLFFLLN